MRLSSVEVIPYALPFKQPYVTARGSLTRREMVLLRVRDGDGVVGLGEAVPLALRGGVGLRDVVRELEAWGELEEAQTLSAPEEAQTLSGPEVQALSAPARCAVATALMDLRGQRVGRGLGEEARDEAVECNATLVAGPPDEVAAEAETWAQAGFTTFKLKLGAETAKTTPQGGFLRSRRSGDVAQVRAVREALGPGVRIRVDANEAWDLETAQATLAALEPFEVELAEQPVAGLEAMATLAASSSIPLAADESVTSRAEAEEAVALGACAYTGIKLSKVGGPEEALAIADVLPAYVTSALDGPVGIAAAAQVALSLAEAGDPDLAEAGHSDLAETDHRERLRLAHGLATQRLFAATIAAVECEIRDGMLHLPRSPGLGVEIDEEALQAHRI